MMERTETIFEQALELPAPQRAAFLDRSCAGDSRLRERMQKLVNAHEKAEHLAFLSAELDTESPDLGERIDRYKLLEKIGEGGCGIVYVAAQEEPVSRRVALKVIKLGMDTRAVVARFEAERQALAMMDHPNIARVFDAGATATGRPFFVMELVRGDRITEYCDRSNLSTRERLDLFARVCLAIEHAHQKGIIHRDIKPSNILVTFHDGVAVPKIIDFGIAKAIEGRLTDGTIHTQLHQFIGTPAYMSPEQSDISGVDIDTRSDIYSLGVLLYELLTGRTPFARERLMRAGLDEVRRIIRQEEPPTPSMALSASTGGAHPKTDRPHRADTARLIAEIRGDLDWIVMKALEKDRNRRYETASAFAADIQRYLRNEPVTARPPTPAYRFQKMIRRNRLAFAAAATVVAALLVGLILTFSQAKRARQAEQTIRRNAYVAQMSVAFQAFAQGDLGRARQLLNLQRPGPRQDDLRGFDWRHLWSLCQSDELCSFDDEGAAVAAFSPDGKVMVYAWDTLIVRDVASRSLITNLSISAFGLSFSSVTNLLATGNDSSVTLWNTRTWEAVRSLSEARGPCLFSSDGQWLLTGLAGKFRVWNTRTWQPLGDCDDAPSLAFQTRYAVAFSPDSRLLVTAAGEGLGDHLCVWRLPSLERLPDIRIQDQEPASLAFSADGKHLLIGLRTGELIVHDFEAPTEFVTLPAHTAWVTCIALAPNGRTFVTSSSDRSIGVWDAATFTNITRLRGHVGEALCAAISPDGQTIISGGSNGRPWEPRPVTKLWRLNDRRDKPFPPNSGLVAGFTRNGQDLVTITSNEWWVTAIQTGSLAKYAISSAPPMLRDGVPYGVKQDEPLGALGRTNGSLEIWNLASGALLTTYRGHQASVSVIAFSPKGRHLASGTTEGELKIWALDDWHQVTKLRFPSTDSYLSSAVFSPDGKTVAAGCLNGKVRLWQVLTGRLVLDLDTRDVVMSLSFSPGGKLLAATTMVANEVRIFQLPSGAEFASLKAHVMGIGAVAFCPDGKTLATGGFDGKVKLWNLKTLQEIVTFPLGTRVPVLQFSPDGRALAIGDLIGSSRQTHLLLAPSFPEISEAEAKLPQR